MGWLSQGFWIYLILQDKNLFCAFEAGDIVCWLVNPPIAKLDLFNSAVCRWICKTYAEYRYRNSATVRRLVQSLTLQSTICCWWPSDLRGSIRVSPAWLSPASSEAGNELLHTCQLSRFSRDCPVFCFPKTLKNGIVPFFIFPSRKKKEKKKIIKIIKNKQLRMRLRY